MTNVVIASDLWDDGVEGVITAWLFDDGDDVATDDVLAEVMVEKIQHEILSPASGTLRIKIAAEEAVMPGDVIGTVS